MSIEQVAFLSLRKLPLPAVKVIIRLTSVRVSNYRRTACTCNDGFKRGGM